jgi:bifunctional DNase/RNase
MTTMRELTLIGIRMESPNRAPVMMLRETDGYRYLPISIGSVEATAIAYEEQGLRPSRPLTHDLMRDLIEAFGVRIAAVEIVELRDAVFYAELVLGNGARVSARPSDSVALAVRLGTPIRCTEQVLLEAGVATRRKNRPNWNASASSWTASPRRTSPADPYAGRLRSSDIGT